MDKLKKIAHLINNFSMHIGSFFIVIGLTFMFLEVVLRYIFNFGFRWAEEITCYAFIYAAMLGASVASSEDSQMKIDIFKKHFPKKIRFIVNIVLRIISLFFLIILFYQGIIFFIEGYRVKSVAAQISLAIPYFSIPLGAIFIFVQELKNTLEEILKKS